MAKARTIVAVTEFSSDLRSLPKPGIRAHARIFCMRCGRHHNLHWGEFKNALDIERVTAHRPYHPGAGMKTRTSLQEIIDIYAFKYCDRESDGDGYDYTCLDAASPRLLMKIEKIIGKSAQAGFATVAEGFSPTVGRPRAKALGYCHEGRLRGLYPI